MPVTKTCRHCGTNFKVPPCRAKTAYTCSKACKYAMAPKTRSHLCRCKTCKAEFYTPISHFKRGNGRFCSRQCHAIWQGASEEYSARVRGEKNPGWRGGRSIHSEGYVYRSAPDHPMASNGYVFEHRLVLEEKMLAEAPDHPFLVDGALARGLVVHHRDDVKNHNDPDNLMAMTLVAHLKWHKGGAVPDPWECWPNIHPGA